MAEAPKLKDYFTEELVRSIGERIRSYHAEFDVERLVQRSVDNGWEEASLTQRSQKIADALWDVLDTDVESALMVLTEILPDELGDPEGVLNEGFWMWPLSDLIATYAIDHPEPAFDACEALTKRFTAEFAIRPFLARYPQALDRIAIWAESENEHVRRLASEGSRPRLPWATRLDLPRDRVLKILASLRRDPSLYVRRSVANHLNDLAKEHNDEILDLLEDWHAEGVEETTWIVRHALRNHLKNGDPRVMALFGYQPADVDVVGLTASPSTVAINEKVEVSFDVVSRATRNQKLMIDLVVGYVKANGNVRPKVLKLKDTELPTESTLSCRKRIDMTPRTTRALYPGKHSVTVRINGADLATVRFDLES